MKTTVAERETEKVTGTKTETRMEALTGTHRDRCKDINRFAGRAREMQIQMQSYNLQRMKNDQKPRLTELRSKGQG